MSTTERLRSAATATAPADASPCELGELAPLVAGQTIRTSDKLAVRSPYNGEAVAVVHRAGPTEIEAATAAVTRAFETTRKLPSWRRAEILGRISATVAARKQEL